MKLISLLPINLREADEEPKDDEKGGGENPFLAADDKGDDSGKEGEEGGDEKDAEAGGGEEGGDAESSEEAKPLEIVFNPNKVRKYNDVKFRDNKGTVTNISRFGVTVTLPDEQTILVNFEDIL